MRNFILLLAILLGGSLFAQDALKPTEEEVLVYFVVTDYNKIPEAEAEVEITPDSGALVTGITGEDGILKALIPKGAECTMKVNKFGKEFLFDEPLNVVDKPGLFALKHTLKIRLITKYIRKYVLEGVHFDTDKWDLRKDAEEPLSKLLGAMEENEKMKIELAGHTDNVGKDEDNMLLSQRRAQAVKEYLISKGVSGDRIVAKGYGETSPIATNDTSEGRQKNRRTEVRVIEE